jgi:predicted RNA-binding protein YlqC (UPF0109 family)
MSEGPDAPGDVVGVDALHEDVPVEDVTVEDVAADAANQAVGGSAQSVLEYMARQIVDEPDAVVIEPDERGTSRVDLRLHVAPDDMGKIIGRRGRVAQAIRTVVRAVGAREGVETTVDIVD